jgi:polar amino acid transport system substrate-binding protein
MQQSIKSLAVTAASAALILASSTSYAASCTNDTWNKVMSRGKMVVGVKADYKP